MCKANPAGFHFVMTDNSTVYNSHVDRSQKRNSKLKVDWEQEIHFGKGKFEGKVDRSVHRFSLGRCPIPIHKDSSGRHGHEKRARQRISWELSATDRKR